MLAATIDLGDTDTAAALVDVLLAAAASAPADLATTWRQIANGLGDGLDQLPAPPAAQPPQPERTRRPPVVRPRDDELDTVAVARVVQGLQPYPLLTEPEAREASRRLTAAGVSAADIAARLGVERRTVCRWRAADRLANLDTP